MMMMASKGTSIQRSIDIRIQKSNWLNVRKLNLMCFISPTLQTTELSFSSPFSGSKHHSSIFGTALWNLNRRTRIDALRSSSISLDESSSGFPSGGISFSFVFATTFSLEQDIRNNYQGVPITGHSDDISLKQKFSFCNFITRCHASKSFKPFSNFS